LAGKLLEAALAGGCAAVITAAVVVRPGGTYQAASHLGPPSRTDLAVDPRPDLPTDTPTVRLLRARHGVRNCHLRRPQ
jgi:hypothetical protein